MRTIKRKGKKLKFTEKDKNGNIKDIGYIEVINENEEQEEQTQEEQTEESEKLSLYFYGDIGSAQWETGWYDEDKCPDDVAKFFDSIDSSKDLDIYFNSGGGDVHAGLAIHNIIKRHQGQTTAHIDGLAASIASVIVCACDKVIVYNGSQVMVHRPAMCARGNVDDFKRAIGVLEKAQESIIDVYMTKVKDGIERSTIEELVNNETWMTTADIQNYFDFDIDTSIQSMTACNSTYFDKYNNLPQNIKHTNTDINELTAEKLEQIINNAFKKVLKVDDLNIIEKEKREILNDLDLYGID